MNAKANAKPKPRRPLLRGGALAWCGACHEPLLAAAHVPAAGYDYRCERCGFTVDGPSVDDLTWGGMERTVRASPELYEAARESAGTLSESIHITTAVILSRVAARDLPMDMARALAALTLGTVSVWPTGEVVTGRGEELGKAVPLSTVR